MSETISYIKKYISIYFCVLIMPKKQKVIDIYGNSNTTMNTNQYF